MVRRSKASESPLALWRYVYNEYICMDLCFMQGIGKILDIALAYPMEDFHRVCLRVNVAWLQLLSRLLDLQDLHPPKSWPQLGFSS
mmetsp:Transcript_5648/g.35072  ORF Transcript_5648/g.35072 Transcript_5648/m.35072 type:complete len:86 (+) Transcript_5648:3380-3637(+)